MLINEKLQNHLKDEIEELKKKEGRAEEERKKVMSENKQLVEPLQKATEDVKELKRKLTNYEKDKLSLAVGLIKIINKLLKLLTTTCIFKYCLNVFIIVKNFDLIYLL